jgi:hypothetical protein
VSQNGNVDIPYDKAILLHAQDDVMARVGDKEYLMGKYSSMEKSYKVMDMIREEYQYMREFDTIYNGDKNYCESEPYYVFYFPKDEEVEEEDE